ncbi:GLPGLI family protein [Chryseobacterium sp. T1]
MKKIFQILLLILPLSLVFSQTHRFIYEFQFKSDSTLQEFTKENMALDVNPEDVKFYNYQYIEIDSTNITKKQNSHYWDDYTPAIIRKRNTDVNLSYVLLDNLFVLETTDQMTWKLSEETKQLGGYHLQKVTTQFGGRHWTAWFTKDIDLSEGPYKFRGLPGMIFQISDDKNQFDFTLVKSYKLAKTYNTQSILEGFSGHKPIKISEEKLKKIYLDNYANPLREFKERFKNNTNPDNKLFVMSIEIKSAEQFKELTELSQKRIRDNNNPIEIDKVVKFPY